MNNKAKSCYFLSFIILIEIFILIGYIQIKTTPYYDEIWTYGLANSKNKPFLYDSVYNSFGDSDGADLLYNRWIGGDYYFKYITVQPEDRFDFKNVYDNQTLDLHPPLYYYLLHFVCSFFPNKFSLWFGYSINIIFVIFTQIILFKIGFLISNNEKYALVNCLFFALSMGAVNEFICVRMYGLLGFFYLCLAYLAICICIKESLTLSDLYKVFIIAFLGFLTDNQFYYYVFALTLSCLTYLAYKKQYRLIIEYLSTGTLCLLSFWNYFPWLFVQIQKFDSISWKASNCLLRPFPLKEILGNLSVMNNYIWGLDTSYQMNIFRYLLIPLNNYVKYVPVWLSLILLLALLYCLFKYTKCNYKWLIFLFTFMVYHVLLSANTFFNRSLFFFGIYTFSILPCFSIVFLYTFNYLTSNFVKKEKLCKLLFFISFIFFIFFSHFNSDHLWCCDLKPGTKKICEFLKDKNVIYVVDSSILVDIIIHAKPWDFMKAKRVFASRSHNVGKILNAVVQLPSNEESVLFLPDSQKGENLYNQIIKLKNILKITFVGIDNVQACSFYMFILKT